jgi:coenzyme PQQ biosynthesis protein PqqD
MIERETKPRLARKARLRFDRKTGRTMLLYPEKGLTLTETAAEILGLCSGELTVGGIIERLAAKYGEERRAAIERETLDFLAEMADRCLLEGAP